MKTFIFYDNMMHLYNINKLNIPYVHTDGIFENNEFNKTKIKIVDFYVDDISTIVTKLNNMPNIRLNKIKYTMETVYVKDINNMKRTGYIIA